MFIHFETYKMFATQLYMLKNYVFQDTVVNDYN